MSTPESQSPPIAVADTFCWLGVVTSDRAATTRFLETAAGWRAASVDMAGNPVTMFAVDGAPLAHLEDAVDGGAASLAHYLRVDDVDARTAAAVAHGGATLVQPMDIPPGRFSLVALPSGATVNLWRDAADPMPAPTGGGALHWVELRSTDLDADLAWLDAALGIGARAIEMPGGPYTLLERDGATIGGALADERSRLLAWIEVAEVDAALDAARDAGGAVAGAPHDVEGVGRLAVVTDPCGIELGLIAPARQP